MGGFITFCAIDATSSIDDSDQKESLATLRFFVRNLYAFEVSMKKLFRNSLLVFNMLLHQCWKTIF